MSIPLYLAMTAADFSSCSRLPPHVAWMACHFSASGTGLSNQPNSLPPESLLILDDQIPWNGHSLEQECRETAALLQKTGAEGILLDFERPPTEETLAMAILLTRHCTAVGTAIGMPELYAQLPEAAIFLPPLPCYQTPAQALSHYGGRELWLEASGNGCRLEVGAQGTQIIPESPDLLQVESTQHALFQDPGLLCQYFTEKTEEGIRINLFDIPGSLQEKLDACEEFGATRAVAPWQQMRQT